MASVVKSSELGTGSDTPTPAPSKQPPAKPTAKTASGTTGGFFSIYKRSQGYWTRMGTAITAAVIGAFIAWNIYANVPTLLSLPAQPPGMPADMYGMLIAQSQVLHQRIALGSSLGFLLIYAIIGWRLMNKPRNVEFLIATDVEMKKVNWTTRRELIGSTKVVIVFMFLTAIFLFGVDLIFRFLMQVIHVLNWGAPF